MFDTKLESYYTLSFLRFHFNNLLVDFINEFEMIQIPGYFRDLVKAEAFSAAKVGNCSEFSAVAYTTLLTDTTGQWVYNCCFKEHPKEPYWDHCFTITSPFQLKKDFTDSNDNALSKEQIQQLVVVDGWDDYRITYLPNFLKRFGESIQSLQIIRGRKAGTAQPLSNVQKHFIQQWVADFMQHPIYNRNALEFIDTQKNSSLEYTTEEKRNEWYDGHSTYGDETPLPRTLLDKRSLKDQILDSIDEDNMEAALDLLRTEDAANIQMVAIKLLDVENNLLTQILREVPDKILYKFPFSVTAVLFSKANDLNRQINYIKYLKGSLFGLASDTKAIEGILLFPGNDALYKACKSFIKIREKPKETVTLRDTRHPSPDSSGDKSDAAVSLSDILRDARQRLQTAPPGMVRTIQVRYGDEMVELEVFEEEKQY